MCTVRINRGICHSNAIVPIIICSEFGSILTDILSPQEDKTKHPLLLSLSRLCRLRLQLSEFLAVAKNHVHVLVEGFELTDEGAGVLQKEKFVN